MNWFTVASHIFQDIERVDRLNNCSIITKSNRINGISKNVEPSQFTVTYQNFQDFERVDRLDDWGLTTKSDPINDISENVEPSQYSVATHNFQDIDRVDRFDDWGLTIKSDRINAFSKKVEPSVITPSSQNTESVDRLVDSTNTTSPPPPTPTSTFSPTHQTHDRNFLPPVSTTSLLGAAFSPYEKDNIPTSITKWTISSTLNKSVMLYHHCVLYIIF